MKFQTISTLLSAVALVHASTNPRHVRLAHKRDAAVAGPNAAAAATGTSNTAAPTAPAGASSTGGPPAGTPATGPATGPSSGPATGTQPPGTPTGAPANPLPATGSIPLSIITSGMPVQSTLPLAATYTPGAVPPVSGAPVLPPTFVLDRTAWPTPDVVPPTDTPEVKEWLKELDGWNIPDYAPNVADAMCDSNPAAKADAANRGWWTCAPGVTRATDINNCPDRMTWGVSFDDGPSDYTQTLLNFLTEKQIHATFFVVGSRVIQRPAVLVEEYMSGHEISVHTWSHRHLTTLTNEQIVAELGWTRKAIQNVLGVTPTTMRPPYGDIDDRVRAISLAMGLIPIIWTRSPNGEQMDTNDWKVAGGLVTGTDSFAAFQGILGNASTMETGFIVLEHDLFQHTVDLSTQYFLPTALSHQPPFTLKAIGQCNNIPATNLYRESNINASFPFTNSSASGKVDVDGDGKSETAATSKDSNANGGVSLAVSRVSVAMLGALAFMGLLL